MSLNLSGLALLMLAGACFGFAFSNITGEGGLGLFAIGVGLAILGVLLLIAGGGVWLLRRAHGREPGAT